MKLLQIAALALCLNVTSVNAIDDFLFLCCPFFCGMSHICIKEGFHRLHKANNVEKAQETREPTSSMEEGINVIDERLPHGASFPKTYVPIRRRQGYAYIAAGAILSAPALYTTGSTIMAIME